MIKSFSNIVGGV